MLVTSRFAHSPAYLCREQVAEGYDPSGVLVERSITLDDPRAVQLTSQQLTTTGLLLLDAHLHLQQPATGLFAVVGESITMSFFLSGQVTRYRSATRLGTALAGNVHNLHYGPVLRASLEVPVGEPVDYFAIILSKDFFLRLLAHRSQLHPGFMAAVTQTRPARLVEHHLPITAEMHQLIYDIRHCTREGLLKRCLVEAKITELLLLQLEQGQPVAAEATRAVVLRPGELLRVEACRRQLEEQHANPPSLRELARQLGLNESKLKQGFRQQFGTTMWAYIIQFRLNKARQLLFETDLPVGEIATLVGYKNGAHFTAAFKEKFGLQPRAMRRSAVGSASPGN